MTPPTHLTRAAIAAFCLALLAGCSQPLLENDASSGPQANTPAATAVHGMAESGQFQ